jgi:hypothetical protein
MMSWKEVVMAYPTHYHGFSWRDEQKMKKISLRKADSPAEIRIWQLGSRNEKRYAWLNSPVSE